MTIEGRSNVVPMMTLLAIRFGSDYSDIRIISIFTMKKALSFQGFFICKKMGIKKKMTPTECQQKK